jgi:exosortase
MHYIIWIVTAILYSPVLYQLYNQRWQSIDYTHAYFILPIAFWLAWRKRAALKTLIQKTQPAGSPLSLSLLIAGLLMFIFGWRQEYLFISSLSLIPLLYGLILYLYGRATAKTLSFPILYLLLMVPPPLGVLDNITLPMRQAISILTEMILKTFHYPITRDGLLLLIGGHEIYMGAPCSGFRSLITMISLGLVYVYINKNSLYKKTILIVSIIPLALIGNLIRVISMCLVTFYFGENAGQRFFHDASGFVIFLIMIAGLISLEHVLERPKLKKNEP